MDDFLNRLNTMNAQEIFDYYSSIKDLESLRNNIKALHQNNEEIIVEVSPFGEVSRDPSPYINKIIKLSEEESDLESYVTKIIDKTNSNAFQNKFKILCLCESKKTLQICSEGVQALNETKDIFSLQQNINKISNMYYRLQNCDEKFANPLLKKISKTIGMIEIEDIADGFDDNQIKMLCQIRIHKSVNKIMNSDLSDIEKLNSIRENATVSVSENLDAENIYFYTYSDYIQDLINQNIIKFPNNDEAVLAFAKLKASLPSLDLKLRSEIIIQQADKISKGGTENVQLLINLEEDIHPQSFQRFASKVISNIEITPETLSALKQSKLVPFMAQIEAERIRGVFERCLNAGTVEKEDQTEAERFNNSVRADVFMKAIADEITVTAAEELVRKKGKAIDIASTLLQNNPTAQNNLNSLRSGNYDPGFLSDDKLIERYNDATSKLQKSKIDKSFC